MARPETATNMNISLPGNITHASVTSFTISSSGQDVIDCTTVGSTGERTYVGTPMGNTLEASVSFFSSGTPSVGDAGNLTIGDTTFYAVCTSMNAAAAVNDLARFDATYQQVNPTS